MTKKITANFTPFQKLDRESSRNKNLTPITNSFNHINAKIFYNEKNEMGGKGRLSELLIRN